MTTEVQRFDTQYQYHGALIAAKSIQCCLTILAHIFVIRKYLNV